MPENIYKHRGRAYLNCIGDWARVAPLFYDPDTSGNRKLRRGGKSQAPRAFRR